MPTTIEDIEDLVALAERTKVNLECRARDVNNVQVAYGYLSKALRCVRGILLLYNSDLKEEAQALVRMLFEACVQFDWYKEECTINAARATRRFWDGVIVEKHKQWNLSGSDKATIIDGVVVDTAIESQYQSIASQYTTNELKSIRRHGFTQKGVEQLAKKAGYNNIYQILYRNFSRNVHARDHTETLLKEGLVEMTQLHEDYLKQRDSITRRHTFTLLADLLRSLAVGLSLPELKDIEALVEAWRGRDNELKM